VLGVFLVFLFCAFIDRTLLGFAGHRALMTKLCRLLRDRKEETMKTRLDTDNVKSIIFLLFAHVIRGKGSIRPGTKRFRMEAEMDITLGQAKKRESRCLRAA
jgi:hypothetical protein